MIKITNGELVQCVPILQRLTGKELKAKTAWQVAKLVKAADKEVTDYEEARMKLINKYGVKNEDGTVKVDEDTKQYVIEDEFKQTFNNEHKELADGIIELPFNKFNVEDFDNVGFMPAELLMLEPFLNMEE